MTSLPEQLSAAGKSQFEAQFDFIKALTNQAFQSAGQVLALNINASRASVERSSQAVKQLFSASDPRDLLALTSRSQEEFQSMLAYSRELFSIAAGARMNLVRQSTTPALASAPAQAPQQVRPASAPAAAQAQPVPAPQSATEPGAHASAALVVATETEPQPEPVAKPKPLAKAMNKISPKPAGAEHPLSSPVAAQHEVELPHIKPVEASPPPAPVSGTPAIDVKQAQAAAVKNGRKK